MYKVIKLRWKFVITVTVLLTVCIMALLVGSSVNAGTQAGDYPYLYPNLNTEAETPVTQAGKKAYITFDDGPSKVTPDILDTLKALDVKATFFVIGATQERDINTLKRMHEEGHAIGIHSYSHKYNQIYRSVEDYLDDFNEIENWIFEITGEHTQIFRFPGGSNNATAKKGIMTSIATEMTRRGYVYYDWNVIAHDDRKTVYSADRLFENVKSSSKGKLNRDLILLFHDNATRKTTVEVLPRVIAYLKENGYDFEKITPATTPIQFNKPQLQK